MSKAHEISCIAFGAFLVGAQGPFLLISLGGGQDRMIGELTLYYSGTSFLFTKRKKGSTSPQVDTLT